MRKGYVYCIQKKNYIVVKVFNDVIYVLIILGEKNLIYFKIERSVNLEFIINFVSIKIIYINY